MTRLARYAGLMAIASVAILLSQASSAAAKVDVRAQLDDDEARIFAETSGTGVAASVLGGSGGASQAVQRATRLVPACDGNQPTLGEPKDAMCPQAIALCSNTQTPDDLMFWIFAGPPGVAEPATTEWELVGQQCLGPTQAAEAGGAVPAFTLQDFRRLPLPAGRARIQPPSLRTLINVPTNVYVEAGPVVLNTQLIGFPVRVRATPARYHWTFGDGSSLNTTDAGAAYPDMTTVHTYVHPGVVRVRLVTYYAGEYSIAGSAWLPISGQADVPSPAATLTVFAARNQLVQDTLP